MSEREDFEAEERLRKKREAEGRRHSCDEAGCTVDPKGQPIPRPKPAPPSDVSHL